MVIAEKILAIIFMMFSKLQNPLVLQKHDIIKNYLYYLKLLVTFGKEITDVPSCEAVAYNEYGKIIKEEKNDHFSSLIRLLVFNQFFFVTKQNMFGFPFNHLLYYELIFN